MINEAFSSVIDAQQTTGLAKAEATFQVLLARSFSGGLSTAAIAEEAAVA